MRTENLHGSCIHEVNLKAKFNIKILAKRVFVSLFVFIINNNNNIGSISHKPE